MFQAIGVILGAILGGISSRRTRLRRRIDDHLELATAVEKHDAQAAADLRSVASESIQLLIRSDRNALGRMSRKLEVWVIIVGVILFLAPPAGLVYFGATRDTWWGWILVVVGSFVFVIALTAMWQTAWKEPESGEPSDAT